MSLSFRDTPLNSQSPATDTAALTLRARQFQQHFPDLYTYLAKRDAAIDRALARIPSRADIELSCVFNSRAYLERTLRELAPGVVELCDEEEAGRAW